MPPEPTLETLIENVLLTTKTITTATNVTLTGKSGKGENYMGEIVFASATITTTPNPRPRHLDLVLKCSKPDPETATFSTRIIFDQEIRMYDTILPALLAFQATKSPPQPFDNTAKFYGKAATATQDFLALENLKRSGYEMTDRTQALDTHHLEAVLKAYGELHALSAAVGDQKAGLLDELGCEKYEEALRYILESCHMAEITAKSFESTVEDMRGVLDEAILEKWVKFRAQIEHVTTKMRYEVGGLRVFTHGDSWSNNFMYKYDGEKRVERMKILDWQISGYTSPIMDLSYFLFICAEDLEDLDRLLDVYYASFSNALREMGSDAEMVYSKTQFLDDWRKYARFGIACCPVIFKIQLCQEDEVPDIFAEGNEIAEQFLFQLKDKTKYIARVKNVIQYAVKSGLIE